MRYRLINIGREKACREVEVRNEVELLHEVKKHLRSNDVEIQHDGSVVAGFHSVGRVELVRPEPEAPHL